MARRALGSQDQLIKKPYRSFSSNHYDIGHFHCQYNTPLSAPQTDYLTLYLTFYVLNPACFCKMWPEKSTF